MDTHMVMPQAFCALPYITYYGIMPMLGRLLPLKEDRQCVVHEYVCKTI
jgi:hypothetical protein